MYPWTQWCFWFFFLFPIIWFEINTEFKCQKKTRRKKKSLEDFCRSPSPQPSSKYSSRILLLLQYLIGNTCSLLFLLSCFVDIYWVYLIARYIASFLGETFKKPFLFVCLFSFLSLNDSQMYLLYKQIYA